MAHPEHPNAPFDVNAIRLTGRQWLITVIIVAAVLLAVPRFWERAEVFETGTDYRIPYPLSKDYWLYERRMEGLEENTIAVIGDSVVWGEYVSRNGTLSHFLSEETGKSFVNAGVNGLFHLALEGLVRHYGKAIQDQKVILHCNALWMSSPQADLQTQKEERFNHPRLVPQFNPWIPCYKADMNTRLGIVAERNIEFFQWVRHLQIAYFDQKSVLAWSLADDGQEPPGYPNSYRNPLRQITLKVPSEPELDPERGLTSPRHKPWSDTGTGNARFDWVSLESSYQWAAFQRLAELLSGRGNDLLVVVGPFNTHFMNPGNRPEFQQLIDGIGQQLTASKTPHIIAATLPSDLYGDASHPLTDGYALLAKTLSGSDAFKRWLDQ